MSLKLFRPVWLVICLLGLFTLAQETVAQTAIPVRPAVLAFSVDMAKLKTSPLAPLFSQMESTPVTSGPQAMFANASAISGSLSLPASAQDLMTMGPNEDIPFDFVVRMSFPDSATFSKVWSEMSAGFEPAEVDGISGFRLPNEETPNMLFTQLDDVSMAVGTKAFIKNLGKSNNSKGVNELLASLPDHGVRLALDLSNSTDLLDEVKEMLGGQLPPEAAPFFDVAMKIESLKFSADLEHEKMLVLGVRGRDEEATKEIFQTVDGLLNMAKFVAGAQLTKLKEESPKTAEVASKILAALKPKNEGNEMTLEIAQPEGMKEMMQESIKGAADQAKNIQDMNRLRQAALSVLNYHDAYRGFPFENPPDKSSRDLSWRVRMLPFLDELSTYKEINTEQGFESSANQAFADRMPEVLGKGSKSLSDISHIAHDKPIKDFAQIPDGTSNTIMLIQYKPGQAWMNPKGLTVDEAVKLFSDLQAGESLLVSYFDGSVRRLGKQDLSPDQFRSALLPDDGK